MTQTPYATLSKRDQLWLGSTLAIIAHAISVKRFPYLVHEHSWDDSNYCVQNTQGAKGVLSFDEQHVVGAFFDSKSPRSPQIIDGNYDSRRFLTGLPSSHTSLLEEALSYMLDDFQGRILPVLTALFWDEASYLISVEDWEQTVLNGVHMISTHLMEPEAAIDKWQEDYDMSPTEVEVMRSLFYKKMSGPHEYVIMESWEVKELRLEMCDETDAKNITKSLLMVGIVVPLSAK